MYNKGCMFKFIYNLFLGKYSSNLVGQFFLQAVSIVLINLGTNKPGVKQVEITNNRHFEYSKLRTVLKSTENSPKE